MRKKIFEDYPIPKAILTLAIPTILGMLITVVYNLVDAFFIGQTGDTFQVAAVSLVMPFFYTMMAVGGIFGIGGGTYISRLLGKKQVDQAKNVSVFCFYTCILFSIILTIILFGFREPILKLLGTSLDTHGFAREYYLVLVYGAVSIVMQYCLGHILRAEGATANVMIGLLIGAVVNIILDPILILNLSLGIKGAAIATVIGNVCSVIYCIIYLLKGKTVLSIDLKRFFIKKDTVLSIIKIGIPASL
ncbi:MAG: MATE family efflux transporter, partial [Bacilli bacterium]|nr:MATE family efflux transporter [Bacilli bacterium]